MKISAIIPTLNEAENIGLILTDLISQSQKPDEIIVVDGSSTDHTRTITQSFADVKLITTTSNVGHQRTVGGKASSGQWLLFLDADVRIEERFIEKLLNQAEAKHLGIACPKYYAPYNASLLVKIAFAFFNAMFFLFQKITPSGAGPCILVKKGLFDAVDGFSSYNYEDIEFIRKASRKGRFGIVGVPMITSDRRFKKYGSFYILTQYLLLSPFFIFGAFRAANVIKYPFGNYKKSSGLNS